MRYIKTKNKEWLMTTLRLVSVLFCMLVMMLAFPMKTLASEGVVQASSANIRSSADPGSAVLAGVMKGDKLSIKEKTQGTDGNSWYKVFIDGQTLGYIRADLVSTSDSVPSASNTTTLNEGATTTENNSEPNTGITVNTEGVSRVQPVSASVTKDKVRVRADSTTDAGIVVTIKKDVVFTINGTKTNASNEVWYLVVYVVNGTDVTGYIRSDFVNLSGELLPYEETPVDVPETPEEPEETSETPITKDFETKQEDDVWYLVDNVGGSKYQISKLITTAQQNAADLKVAQNKVSKQKTAIVILSIVLVIMALGITLLVFKLKDILDGEGFELRNALPRRPGSVGNRPMSRPVPERRPGVQRPMPGGSTQRPRPTERRPMSGTGSDRRPGAQRPMPGGNGQRPMAAGNGQRPMSGGSSQRPMSGGNGQRPMSGGSSQRPMPGASSQRPMPNGNVQRPAQGGNNQRPVPSANSQRPAQSIDSVTSAQTDNLINKSEDITQRQIEQQTRAHVENRSIEKEGVDSQTWKTKNFIADDEFEFEFLNWDGEEENK